MAPSLNLTVKGHLEEAWGFDTRSFYRRDPASIQEFPRKAGLSEV